MAGSLGQEAQGPRGRLRRTAGREQGPQEPPGAPQEPPTHPCGAEAKAGFMGFMGLEAASRPGLWVAESSLTGADGGLGCSGCWDRREGTSGDAAGRPWEQEAGFGVREQGSGLESKAEAVAPAPGPSHHCSH